MNKFSQATFNSNGNQVVPAGVYFMLATMCGGGGGGSGSHSGFSGAQDNTFATCGAGGGGAMLVQAWIPVTPGDTLAITVGGGGAGGAANTTGSPGTASKIVNGSSVTLLNAPGAQGGQNAGGSVGFFFGGPMCTVAGGSNTSKNQNASDTAIASHYQTPGQGGNAFGGSTSSFPGGDGADNVGYGGVFAGGTGGTTGATSTGVGGVGGGGGGAGPFGNGANGPNGGSGAAGTGAAGVVGNNAGANTGAGGSGGSSGAAGGSAGGAAAAGGNGGSGKVILMWMDA